ncbi:MULTISPECIES: hypothetical protein [unclassified Butyrivibrio]|uniref:hypothetical protein n=1 Tax=unclassified Butyrivibrio TaxID=2639466 RepID=UPI0003FDCA69|nr:MULTISPECIES: hypothetical protein [unclassified Butyrivibrio]
MNSKEIKPMILFFAGPNGSGKSTITEFFEMVGEYTNADDVVKATGCSNIEAARIVDERRWLAIKEHKDISFETVLSSNYKLDILNKAKDEGYFIKGVFVLTSNPEINVARIRSRVSQGGHDVDDEKVRFRYWKSLKNINILLDICDILHVYDNSGDKPIRIIRKHKEELTIYPNNLWDKERIFRLMNGEIDS